MLMTIYVIAGPVVTDNGNFVIDAPFDFEKIKQPIQVCFFSYWMMKSDSFYFSSSNLLYV